jgi:hypothetical protein
MIPRLVAIKIQRLAPEPNDRDGGKAAGRMRIVAAPVTTVRWPP